MNRSTSILCLQLLVSIFFICSYATITLAQNHPVILGDTTQYVSLRAKASQEPWKTIKSRAISNANSYTYTYNPSYTSSSYSHYCYRTRAVATACGLSYILDPSNKSIHASKAADQMIDGLTYLIDNRPGGWTGNVPFGMVIFECIMVLDVIYNDISSSDRNTLENKLGGVMNTFSTSWAPSPQAIRATWALYNGDQQNFDLERQDFHTEMMDMFSPDGVFYPGTGYATARMSGNDRPQKHMFIDILEIQGYNNYYSNPILQQGYEWVYGYTTTPYGKTLGFGDSSPDSWGTRWTSNMAAYRAFKFSQNAQEYANWGLTDEVPRPYLISYFLFDNNFDASTESFPPSKIYPDGGAWFHEDVQSKQAFQGVLWNPKGYAQHQHYEVNAISLAYNNETLLSNAGYSEWGSGEGDYTWTDIHDRAITANTVLIDYPLSNSASGNFSSTNNHQEKFGAGIQEGFLTDKLEYACGSSGNALPNGDHERSFFYIKGNGVDDYWILVDNVSGAANADAHIALHPYSTNVSTLSTKKDYEWSVQKWNNYPTYLWIGLGQEPDQVQLLSGRTTDFGSGVPHTYLYNTYNLGATGERNLITLMRGHTNAGGQSFSRINGADYSGTLIDQGNSIEDYVLESSSPYVSSTYNNYSFTGDLTVIRATGGVVDWYFVKNGFNFSAVGNGPLGFTSQSPISIMMEGNTGKITAANGAQVGIEVDAANANCTRVKLNGQLVTTSVANGYVYFSVPVGTHDVELIQECLLANITVLLEGPLTMVGNVMIDSVKSMGLLPTVDPYVGTYTTDFSQLPGNTYNQLIDWIWVELRNANNLAVVESQQAGLLLNDGTVLSVTGNTMDFGVNPGDYYIYVQHRNHLPAMSAAPISFMDGQTVDFDFSQQNSYVGTGSGQKEVRPGVWALFTGDSVVDPNGYDINGDDKALWNVENGLFFKYRWSDFDMNGDVNGGDRVLLNNNFGTFSGIPKP